MITYWLLCDGQHIHTHRTPFELPKPAQERLIYQFAKDRGLGSPAGLRLFEIHRAQSQHDFKSYQMRKHG